MTAFVCQNCGQWIGTEYKGNAKYGEHKCDPSMVEAATKAKIELDNLEKDYWQKRRNIENSVIKHSYA